MSTKNNTVKLSQVALDGARWIGAGDPQLGATRVLELLGHMRAAMLSAAGDGSAEDAPIPAPPPEGSGGFGFESLRFNPDEFVEIAADRIGRAIAEDGDSPSTVAQIAMTAILDRCMTFAEIVNQKFYRDLWETFGRFLASVFIDIEEEVHAPTAERKARLRREPTEWARLIVASEIPAVADFDNLRPGGASESVTLQPPTPEQIAAFSPLVKQLHPIATAIMGLRKAQPDTWKEDALLLRSVAALESSHRAVLDELVRSIKPQQTVINSEKLAAKTFTHEWVRRALKIKKRCEKDLRMIARASDDMNASPM